MSQLSLPSTIAFDQGRPFYDMVAAYLTALVGLESVIRPDNPMGFKSGEVVTLEGKAHPEIRVDHFTVHQQVVSQKISAVNVTNSLVNMLMNTAYKAVKDKNDGSSEFEFFRHVRNASSHKNVFNFFSSEPSKSASWRGKSLDHTQRGNQNPLHGSICFGEFLASADAIVLLWDIEQRL